MPPSVPLGDRLRYELTHLWGFATGYRLINIGCAPATARDGADLRWSDAQSWSLAVYTRLWADLERHAPRPNRAPRVLEVGCGQGEGLRHLSLHHEGAWAGVDLSLAATLLTRLRGNRARWGASQALPFADAGFDVVFAIESVLIFPEADRALAELRRVLVRGGRLGLVEFSDRPIEDARSDAISRAERAGLRCVAFDDHTADARRAIVLGEPLRAAANRRIPPPLRGKFAEMMSLRGTRRHDRWVAGGYSYWSAVFEAL